MNKRPLSVTYPFHPPSNDNVPVKVAAYTREAWYAAVKDFIWSKSKGRYRINEITKTIQLSKILIMILRIFLIYSTFNIQQLC